MTSVRSNFIYLFHLFIYFVQAYKEDIEEISNAAEKEARIEAKLAEIQEQWSEMAFTFADFKHKVPQN